MTEQFEGSFGLGGVNPYFTLTVVKVLLFQCGDFSPLHSGSISLKPPSITSEQTGEVLFVRTSESRKIPCYLHLDRFRLQSDQTMNR